MSAIETTDAEEDVQEKNSKKQARSHGAIAAELETVTDYAEEKEIATANLSSTVEEIGHQFNKSVELRIARERELQEVNLKKQDIELIMDEMLITQPEAEQALREQNGVVIAALEALVNSK